MPHARLSPARAPRRGRARQHLRAAGAGLVAICPLAPRAGLRIPEGAVSIAVSLDGVLAPTDGANNAPDVRAKAAAEGWVSKGPAGYREASCATVSFCDAKGDLLGAIRLARAPETKKATLKKMLTAETSAILARRPDLKLVKVADGAADNWAYLASWRDVSVRGWEPGVRRGIAHT